VEREILVPIRRIADIHVGDRHRRDLGDIPGSPVMAAMLSGC
jgi:hypothetical protein